MSEKRCSTCSLRSRYDNNPESLSGRFWKFHIRYCPGWKGYMKSLAPEEREALKNKYSIITGKY